MHSRISTSLLSSVVVTWFVVTHTHTHTHTNTHNRPIESHNRHNHGAELMTASWRRGLAASEPADFRVRPSVRLVKRRVAVQMNKCTSEQHRAAGRESFYH